MKVKIYKGVVYSSTIEVFRDMAGRNQIVYARKMGKT